MCYHKVGSQKVLTDSLRQMIDDGLVYRHDYQEMPPKVEYGLPKLGKEIFKQSRREVNTP